MMMQELGKKLAEIKAIQDKHEEEISKSRLSSSIYMKPMVSIKDFVEFAEILLDRLETPAYPPNRGLDKVAALKTKLDEIRRNAIPKRVDGLHHEFPDARDIEAFGKAVIEAMNQRPEPKPDEVVEDTYEVRELPNTYTIDGFSNKNQMLGIYDKQKKCHVSICRFYNDEREAAEDLCTSMNIGRKLRNKMES